MLPRVATVLAFACAAAGTLAAENWPQWRGPGGQGISPETQLATRWSPVENIAWKAAVPGRGHSAPVVWNDRVFLTTAIEGETVTGAKAPPHLDGGRPFLHPDSVGANRTHTFKVLAFDAGSGALVWERTAWEGTPYDDRHRRGSYASPSVATDGRRVYAYFGSEGIYAYAFDGRLLWKASVGKIPTLGLGVASSPILFGDLLILQCDVNSGESSALVALDAATGRERWRTSRPVQVSWSTPVLVRTGARTELVTNGTEWIIAYDPASGRELWRTKGVQSNAIHTPVAADGVVICTAGYPAKRVIAIRAGGSGDVTGTDRILWTYEKGTAYVVSPILHDGVLYLVNDQGVMTALDARTGTVIYEGGRMPAPATFMGSPVAAAGQILLTSEDGDTFVIRAGRTHEVIATNSIDEPVYSTPAIANGRIFIRGERHLYAVGHGSRRGAL